MADSPFKLFEPYNSADKDIFFGRDAEIYALYNLLQQTRLILFYGASGTGKTSIINAGLPKVFKLTDWSRISVRRKDNINKSFRSELRRLLGQDEISSLSSAINDIYENRWIPIYLVFDQFEEIFTLGDHNERLDFFKDIQTLLTLSIPCKIILSMREEYIGHLYEYEQFVPLLFDKRFRVEPMKDETTRSVIMEMSESADIALENGQDTARNILMQVKEGTQAAHLPYLQIYLHYLYVQECKTGTSKKITFTENGILTVGRLGNVLRLFIESMLEKARVEFVAMGLPDDFASGLLDEFATDEGTKQSRKISELVASLDVDEGKMRKALIFFSDSNLLRPDEDDVSRYEPVHDVVAKQINELRSSESKEFKAFLRSFQSDYGRWVSEKMSETRFLTESDIAKANIYCARLEKIPDYESHWKSYVEASTRYNQEKLSKAQREAIEKEERNRELSAALDIARDEKNKANRSKLRANIISIATIFCCILAVTFYNRAESQKDIAVKEREKSDNLRKEAEKSKAIITAQRDTARRLEIKATEALEQKKNAIIALRISNTEKETANKRVIAALKETKTELTAKKRAMGQRDSIEVKKYISAAQRMHKIQKYEMEVAILKKGLGKLNNHPELLDSLKSLERQIQFLQP
ncbi:ATP-binding protein [Dyadobacter sp. CY356]|uniref:ATP-binding protein n=1 Tax=Dyadobacter sp. CY356 TaxID=2906442 RepID=UPI001F2E55CB|nr:ATP-binding protein [Dyadobacter sp. CY356]MCF0054782.1 hypothetical protein [Dyadobacter sp. CY356]